MPPQLFEILEGAEHVADWTVRERRLLDGALAFHALMAPARTLEVHLYDGDWSSLPRTTDDATFDGLSRAFRRRLSTLVVRSMVPVPEGGASLDAPAAALVDAPQRHLRIPRDSVLDFDPPRELSRSPLRRMLRAVRSRAPLAYDQLRDLELLRHRRSFRRTVRRRDYDAEFAPGGQHEDDRIVTAGPAREAAPPAVLIGVHWFELGGAERWAFETVKRVRDAGLLPIVLSNRDSHQPWIGRPELDGCLIVPFSEVTVASQTAGTEPLLRAILENFDVRAVIVHHNQWLYDRLPWIARSRPGLPVIDSTHIVEMRGGGYPVTAAMADSYITKHHVISPSLARWMTGTQRIDPAKVVMAPLADLTVEGGAETAFRPRSDEAPFVVAFVGRMARQKAPEVFVEIVHRLRRTHGSTRMDFVMHGDGEMSGWVDDIIRREHLQDVIRRRHSDVPVALTLDEAHLLVIPSHNEGLTLTTFEAIAHGVPVVSTDVGAQADIVPRRALFPADVYRAVRHGARLVAALALDEGARERLWHDERDAQQRLVGVRSASEWFEEEAASW